MTWKELSDALNYKRKKKKVVYWETPCKACIEWNWKKGILCPPCRKAGVTFEDHEVVVWE